MIQKGTNLLIHSIYRATEGEGLWIGMPQIFVRFQGCAVGCVNCDSMDTWSFNEGQVISVSEAMDKIRELSGQMRRVSITGGDPLHPYHVPSLKELIVALKMDGYFVNIEAAGTRIVDDVFTLVDFISYDYKTPSTKVKTSPDLILKLHEKYQGKYQIKSVVADKHDFEASFDVWQMLKSKTGQWVPWVLTPAYMPGEEFPMERFKLVMKWNEDFGGVFRVIGQQHKWVYGPNETMV